VPILWEKEWELEIDFLFQLEWSAFLEEDLVSCVLRDGDKVIA